MSVFWMTASADYNKFKEFPFVEYAPMPYG